MSEKTYSMSINFKDGGSIDLTVYDKIPATTGHNLLAWVCTDGEFYMVNESEVEYIQCRPVSAGEPSQ